MVKRLIKREDVPNRFWYPFMNKINDAILGNGNVRILREDVPYGDWSEAYNKLNAFLENPDATDLQPLTRGDFKNWFPMYDVINRNFFGVVTVDGVGVDDLQIHFVSTKETYEKYVSAAYREQYDWETTKASGTLPWIVVGYKMNDDAVKPMMQILADGVNCSFKNIPESIGEVSEEGKRLFFTTEKGIMFEKNRDLGITAENPEVKVIVSQEEMFTEVSGKQFIDSGVENLTAVVVTTEEEYNQHVPAEYREKYDYAASKDSLPWIVAKFKRTDMDLHPAMTILKDDTGITLTDLVVPESVGVKEGNAIKLNAKDYVMLDIDADLKITESAKITIRVSQAEFESTASADYTK